MRANTPAKPTVCGISYIVNEANDMLSFSGLIHHPGQYSSIRERSEESSSGAIEPTNNSLTGRKRPSLASTFQILLINNEQGNERREGKGKKV